MYRPRWLLVLLVITMYLKVFKGAHPTDYSLYDFERIIDPLFNFR